MDPAEYLAFIPLLFYGIALAELLGQWKRFFEKARWYWPYFLTTIMFTELAIWNVYLYLDLVGDLEGISYYRYWIYLMQPMIFLLTVSALIPEADNQDTEGCFKRRMPVVFGLMAAFIASHLLHRISSSQPIQVVRVIAIAMCIAIAVTKRVSLVYVTSLVWLLSLFTRN